MHVAAHIAVKDVTENHNSFLDSSFISHTCFVAKADINWVASVTIKEPCSFIHLDSYYWDYN